jgi:hypothetical protein
MIEQCSEMVKRITVTLDDEQHRTLRGHVGFGTIDAERIRNILVAYISKKCAFGAK